MAAFSFNVVLEKIKQQRERVVILILLAVLLAISWNTYATLQLQKTDMQSIIEQILREHGYVDPVVAQDVEEETDPLKVGDSLLEVPPPEDIVRVIIEVDPLRPREDISQIRERIALLLEEARVLQEQGKWADAITVYDRILELDPAGVKYDYRGGTPQELRAACVREQTRERMVQAKTEADRGYERGKQYLEAGEELKARDVLLQARRDYGQISVLDPDRSILDEAFYAEIDSRIEELTETTRWLVRKTLSEDIAAKREQAQTEMAAYQEDPSDLDRLGAAREALVEGLSIVDLVDPAQEIVGASVVKEISTLLSDVEEMISGVVPEVLEKANQELTALQDVETLDEGILKAESALALIDTLRRLRPEVTEYEQRYREVEAVRQSYRRALDLQRARGIYEEARVHYLRSVDAVRMTDRATAGREKETVLAILARLRSLPEENIAPILEEARKLEDDLNAWVVSLDPISGVRLTALDPEGKWVRLKSGQWQDTMHFLNQTHSRTGIKVVEIHPNPEGEPPYATISRQGSRDTKVSLGTR